MLVVEDEPLIRMLICDLLEEEGCACADAADADDALAMLDAGWCPHILVTDYNLGPGPDGVMLAAEAMQRLPDLPVVYVTGNPECVTERPLSRLERVVAKPFVPAHLIAAIHELAPHGHAVPSGASGSGRLTNYADALTI